MCKCNSITNTCEGKQYAVCTFFEGSIPNFTKLVSSECYNLEEIIADLYSIEGDIKDNINLEDLLNNSIPYELTGGEILVKKAIKKHADLLIEMQETLESLTAGNNEIFNISGWNLDFGCLADSCDNPPVYLKDLLQLMINKTCSDTEN